MFTSKFGLSSMKKPLHAVCAAAAVLVIAAFPERVHLQDQAGVERQCSAESKDHYYQDFLARYEGLAKDKAQALEAAKRYLACSEYLGDQQEKLASVNLAVGQILILKGLSRDAIAYLIKAAFYNSPVKTSPQTYAYLAEAYENGPYAKLSAAYQVRYSGKDETDEGRLAYANILQVVDRMIDAYARAVALSPMGPSKTTAANRPSEMQVGSPADWMAHLNELYRFRHNGSGAGLEELIGTVLSQPLPPVPAPIASLPPPKSQ